eukprot:COSAG04_NODE_785_length_10316_cov_29.681120_6_plen_521_part_00
MSQRLTAMNAAGDREMGAKETRDEYALRLKDLGVKQKDLGLPKAPTAFEAEAARLRVEARAKAAAAAVAEGRWVANLRDTEGRNAVHLCVLSPRKVKDGLSRDELLLRLLRPLDAWSAQIAVTAEDAVGHETPLGMALSSGLAESSGAEGRGWVAVCVTLVQHGATLASLGKPVLASLKEKCSTRPLSRSAFGAWLGRQLGREERAANGVVKAKEKARRARMRRGPTPTAEEVAHSTAEEKAAMIEVELIQLRKEQRTERLADKARRREKQKKAKAEAEERALIASVRRQSDQLELGKQQAAKREKQRKRQVARVQKIIAADAAQAALVEEAKEAQAQRRAERLAAEMQKESGEEEGLTEVEWRKRTAARLAKERAAEEEVAAATAPPADVSVLAEAALEAEAVSKAVAVELVEGVEKRQWKAQAAQRLGQARDRQGMDDKLTLALLEYGFLTSGGELMRAAKAKKEAEAMAQRALWLAKKAALEEQMLAMERAHLPPREGALGPGTPRPGGADEAAVEA